MQRFWLVFMLVCAGCGVYFHGLQQDALAASRERETGLRTANASLARRVALLESRLQRLHDWESRQARRFRWQGGR